MLYQPSDSRRPWGDAATAQPWRNEFMRDYGRIIHSASFRRLQGKTQVFPGHESDFFRNRLTHSLEVAQIAEGIVDRLNFDHPYFSREGNGLSSRLCATAALVHDLGHPPFGHNGERALDAKMLEHGGFEGNAQTLRIISHIEKKVMVGGRRYGLNLTFRTLAAILKYDREIPARRDADAKVAKGYYSTERDLVDRIKAEVTGGRLPAEGDFKTVECAIMDLADDIAYSTFDLEDALKVGFLSPGSILASTPELLSKVAQYVSRAMGRAVTPEEIVIVLQELFEEVVGEGLRAGLSRMSDGDGSLEDAALEVFAGGEMASLEFGRSGDRRTSMSSKLVKDAIDGVRVEVDDDVPALTRVYLDEVARLRVETLKQYVYVTTISTHLVKVAEYRGTRIVTDVFDALAGKDGEMLLPEDVAKAHAAAGDESARMRVICDFIAGMTDRYASEFHARLHSEAPQSMFKPL